LPAVSQAFSLRALEIKRGQALENLQANLRFCASPTGKSATQQTGKSALRTVFLPIKELDALNALRYFNETKF
jgi:hypothetical protein